MMKKYINTTAKMELHFENNLTLQLKGLHLGRGLWREGSLKGEGSCNTRRERVWLTPCVMS